jgi:hypothetical protein
MISLACPSCGLMFQVKDECGGSQTKCPTCGTAIHVPTSPQQQKGGVSQKPVSIPAPTHAPSFARRISFQPKDLLRPPLLYASLGGAGLLLFILVIIVLSFGSRNESNGITSKDDSQAKAKIQTGATDKTGQNSNIVPKSEQPSNSLTETNLEAYKKEERAKTEKEKERPRLEEEKNASELQAPPLGKGTPKDPIWSKMDDFAKRMRDLCSDEFKFREAKTNIFRSTFNQKNLDYSPLIKWFSARNAVISPGKYDFETGYYSLDLMLWHQVISDEKKPTEDSCKLQAKIKVDENTAKKWREAIDNKNFSLTVWYRFNKIERATWKQNPHWDPVPMLAHDIVFTVEVLKFE